MVSSPAHGNVILNGNGSFSYIPTSNYFGGDSFTYQANDGLGASSLATVNLVITNAATTGPQFGILQGPNVFNPQTGLFEQNVIITNTGDTTAAAVRLLVDGLRSSVSLYNASGTNAGRPYVQHNSPLDPNQTVKLVLEFFVGDRRPFTNTLEAQSVLPAYNGTDGATAVAISRSLSTRGSRATTGLCWNLRPSRAGLTRLSTAMTRWKAGTLRRLQSQPMPPARNGMTMDRPRPRGFPCRMSAVCIE